MRPIWSGPDVPQKIKDYDKLRVKGVQIVNAAGYVLFLTDSTFLK